MGGVAASVNPEKEESAGVGGACWPPSSHKHSLKGKHQMWCSQCSNSSVVTLVIVAWPPAGLLLLINIHSKENIRYGAANVQHIRCGAVNVQTRQ